jgi:hypothetical protein
MPFVSAAGENFAEDSTYSSYSQTRIYLVVVHEVFEKLVAVAVKRLSPPVYGVIRGPLIGQQIALGNAVRGPVQVRRTTDTE